MLSASAVILIAYSVPLSKTHSALVRVSPPTLLAPRPVVNICAPAITVPPVKVESCLIVTVESLGLFLYLLYDGNRVPAPVIVTLSSNSTDTPDDAFTTPVK